jgi:uncharacterized protein (UPF0335 family)
MSDMGHNSIAKEELKLLVERIENLEAAKDGIASDIKDLYAEAKGKAWDVKAVKTIVRMRAEDAGKREKREDSERTLESYMLALGMI